MALAEIIGMPGYPPELKARLDGREPPEFESLAGAQLIAW